MSRADRAGYGFDAPDFTRNALIVGAALIAAGWAILDRWGWLGTVAGIALVVGGLAALAPGLCLVAYGMRGKFRVRDRMLAMVPWRGDEQVLDVGTGRGLLLIGAAKHLTSGRAIGIDVWRSEDLSGNRRESALRNAALENVDARIEVRDGDIRRVAFSDGSFDVVLSLLCLHNIEAIDERRAACHEIARVLRPGGCVVVGDYISTGLYTAAFTEAGLRIESSRAYVADALGPMWIVKARKP